MIVHADKLDRKNTFKEMRLIKRFERSKWSEKIYLSYKIQSSSVGLIIYLKRPRTQSDQRVTP